MRAMNFNIGFPASVALALALLAGGGCEIRDGEYVFESAPARFGISGEGVVEADGRQWEGVVGVISQGGGSCTGALIDPQIVLTAGQCLAEAGTDQDDDSGTEGPGVFILGGLKMDEIIAEASETKVHEAADLGIIALPAPVEDSVYYEVSDTLPWVGAGGWIAGYGITGATELDSGTRRIGEAAISAVKQGQIELQGKASTCSGDEGGPFFVGEGEDLMIIGVASIHSEDCSPGSVIIETDTFYYRDWIDEQVCRYTGHWLDGDSCVDDDDDSGDDDDDQDASAADASGCGCVAAGQSRAHSLPLLKTFMSIFGF